MEDGPGGEKHGVGGPMQPPDPGLPHALASAAGQLVRVGPPGAGREGLAMTVAKNSAHHDSGFHRGGHQENARPQERGRTPWTNGQPADPMDAPRRPSTGLRRRGDVDGETR